MEVARKIPVASQSGSVVTWEKRNTSNPVWIFADILHNAVYGAGDLKRQIRRRMDSSPWRRSWMWRGMHSMGFLIDRPACGMP